MKCKYITIRKKKNVPYFFCRLDKRQIMPTECKNCSKSILKANKPIKSKTSKLVKLESNRFSILTTNLDICFCCKLNKKDHMHEIYKGSNRQRCMIHGFCIPICTICHDKTETDNEFLDKYRQECQKEYEKNHKRDEFIEIIGKNYL